MTEHEVGEGCWNDIEKFATQFGQDNIGRQLIVAENMVAEGYLVYDKSGGSQFNRDAFTTPKDITECIKMVQERMALFSVGATVYLFFLAARTNYDDAYEDIRRLKVYQISDADELVLFRLTTNRDVK